MKPFAICLILLAICGYYRRQPTEDDAWFAEESYWLLKVGYVKSEFFRGFLGWDIHYFLSHKLFIALGAGLQYLLPLSPYTSKLSGLLFFCILVIFLLFYQRQNHPQTSNWLLIVLIFSNTLLVRMSFENRPELMVASFGFASFLLIYKDPNHVKSALAAFFASLAALSHLNGVIYIFAGFVLLVYGRNYRNLLIFSVVSIIVGSFYFYDIWQFDGFDVWWYQFSNDPATRDSMGVVNKLKVMASYPKLFFESPEQAALSLLLLALGWHCRALLKSLNPRLVVYLLALLLSFWLLTKSATAIYQVLFIPLFFVLIVELFTAVTAKKTKFSPPVYFASVLYLCVGIVGNLQIIIKNNTNYLPTQMANISAKIVSKKVGLVPLTFFFNEYTHYDKLLCQTNFELQMKYKKEKTLTQNMFFDWANQNKVDFVVLDYFNNNADYYPNPKMRQVGSFQRVYSDGQFAIYRLKK
jgi:hypothetical protein